MEKRVTLGDFIDKCSLTGKVAVDFYSIAVIVCYDLLSICTEICKHSWSYQRYLIFTLQHQEPSGGASIYPADDQADERTHQRHLY